MYTFIGHENLKLIHRPRAQQIPRARQPQFQYVKGEVVKSRSNNYETVK